MKRVEVNMDSSFRGFVSQFADEKDMTMPQAYRHLMEIGLEASDVEIESFEPSVDS